MVPSQNKNMFCDVSLRPFPPLSYNLYTWKLKEANNGIIKNEALLIVPYETHGEHRDTSPPLERNYNQLRTQFAFLFQMSNFKMWNYFLSRLRVGHIREKNGHFLSFSLKKGKLHHRFMGCFIHFFHRVSLWTNFLTINEWVPKKSLLSRIQGGMKTQKTINFGGRLNWVSSRFFAGVFWISPCVWPNSGNWCCVFLTLRISLLAWKKLITEVLEPCLPNLGWPLVVDIGCKCHMAWQTVRNK